MKRNIFFLLVFIFFGAFQTMAQSQDTIAPTAPAGLPQQTQKDILTPKTPFPTAQPTTTLDVAPTNTPSEVKVEETPIVTPPTPNQIIVEEEEEKVGSMNSNGKAQKKDPLAKGKKKKKKGTTPEEVVPQEENRKK
jgi:hypothetical protein